MWNYFTKGVQLVAITYSWSEQAMEDGKVTLKEATELATRICEVLNIPLELDVSLLNKRED